MQYLFNHLVVVYVNSNNRQETCLKQELYNIHGIKLMSMLLKNNASYVQFFDTRLKKKIYLQQVKISYFTKVKIIKRFVS